MAAETRPGQRFRGRTAAAAAALRARVCALAPLFPGAYIYPHGVPELEIYRVEGSFSFYVVV